MTDKQDVWYGLEIKARSEAAEAIEFALNELDAPGTEINNLGPRRSENITVIGYFNDRPDDEIVATGLAEALRIYGLPDEAVEGFEWARVENRDWLAEWKKHWRPTPVGPFIIAPPWESVDRADKIVITIEPNMAFGTGTHETTQLCLRSIAANYRPGQTFLDVGTGTGILAIAVAKLATENTDETGKENKNGSVSSVANILACDTDADSVKIARENAASNGVGGDIGFFSGSIDAGTPRFDLVCANLTIDVIMPILPLLVAKTRAVLLLSGILADQEAQILSELKKFQISDLKVETAGEWISVTVHIGN